MEAPASIVVDRISKKFARSLKRSFAYGAQDIVRASLRLSDSKLLRPSEFWALNDVSFRLERGRSTGIVGLNGSGKTTLLRIISGILRPTTGRVSVNGAIAPMLALGAGFKPVLSGRENVFLNMSLLGLPQALIRQRFDTVVNFADIWDAIDAPLGTYSTGMQTRLGFACAIHTDPDILIIDEVLAVGDAQFRVKCRNRLNELRRSGVSMLLVSHNSISIEALCDECIYLRKGKLAASGSSKEVLALYHADAIASATEQNARVASATQAAAANRDVITGTREQLVIESTRLLDCSNQPVDALAVAEQCSVEFGLRAQKAIEDVSINVILVDQSHNAGEAVQFIVSRSDTIGLDLAAGLTRVRLTFSPLVLRPGIYRMKVSVSTGMLDDILAVLDQFTLVVNDRSGLVRGTMHQPRTWAVEDVVLEPRSDALALGIADDDV